MPVSDACVAVTCFNPRTKRTYATAICTTPRKRRMANDFGVSARSCATTGNSASASAALPHVIADSAASCSRRNARISAAKKTLDTSAMPLPAMPRASNRPTKKSAIPAMATEIAMTSRARIGSRTTSGENSSTHTTPAYCRKIAFAAVVHFVATTNDVRHAP